MDDAVRQLPKETTRRSIAERLREASREEFSQRGYHGARVQGISRRAGCNVALLYRHWASKKALYLDILRAVCGGIAQQVTRALAGEAGPGEVVGAYVDANLGDPVGAQIMIRELLDGGPFLVQLTENEPALLASLRSAASVLAGTATAAKAGLRDGVHPEVAVLCIGGLAALVSAAHGSSRAFLGQDLPIETWRQSVEEFLLHGVLSGVGGG